MRYLFYRVSWVALGLCVGGLSSCVKWSREGGGDRLCEAPRRANVAGYLAPQVKRGKVAGIGFAAGAWEMPKGERLKLRAAATYLKVTGERVILAGSAKESSAEYARQLGQQRALAVQQALVAEGIPANRMATVSFGRDMPGGGGDEVQFGFVPTGEKAF